MPGLPTSGKHTKLKALTIINAFFFVLNILVPKFAASTVPGPPRKSRDNRLEILRAFFMSDKYEIQATAYLQPINSTFSSVSGTV